MPNKDIFKGYDDPDATPGIVTKAVNIKSLEVTDSDLKAINKYTLSPLGAEDVFVFEGKFADNEGDDRNFMPFDRKALKDLKKLYLGKTLLKDHDRKADNQIGRVFATELITDENKETDRGEKHTELLGKVYMVKTDSNADLIAEIKGGIKKELSTSCVPASEICSICGTDNMKTWCNHWPGVEYEVGNGSGGSTKKTCKMVLSGAKDAYEVSLVAVPAQPRAGAYKSVGFAKPVKAPEVTEPEESPDETGNKDLEIGLQIRESESFLFTLNK